MLQNNTALEQQNCLKSSPETVSQLLEKMSQLHPKLIDLSLERLEKLLKTLDHPEKKLPPVIHIAGTNGKGSTLAFLRSGLEAHGSTCHVITSPHLVRFNERIRLAGTLISDTYLADVLHRVLEANQGNPITIFEITMAASFLACAEIPADFLLLETGLGGRFDASNVLETVLLSIITSISLDHQHFLGDTIAKIAFEKAGIIKKGGVCLLAPQKYSEAHSVISEVAEAQEALLLSEQHYYQIQQNSLAGFSVVADTQEARFPCLSLVGQHQYRNAATAYAALRFLLKDRCDPALCQQAFAETTWPARLQVLETGSLVQLLPSSKKILIDGGHNQDAAQMLSYEIPKLQEGLSCSRITLITGMMERRDPVEFYPKILPFVSRCFTVPLQGEFAGYSPETLKEILEGFGGKNIVACPDVKSVFDLIAQDINQGEKEIIIAVGSLYLAGDILNLNQTLPK